MDMRAAAQRLPRIIMRYKAWFDDMGGSRGKKYSPFLNMRIVFAGMFMCQVDDEAPCAAHNRRVYPLT